MLSMSSGLTGSNCGRPPTVVTGTPGTILVIGTHVVMAIGDRFIPVSMATPGVSAVTMTTGCGGSVG